MGQAIGVVAIATVVAIAAVFTLTRVYQVGLRDGRQSEDRIWVIKYDTDMAYARRECLAKEAQ